MARVVNVGTLALVDVLEHFRFRCKLNTLCINISLNSYIPRASELAQVTIRVLPVMS